MVPSVASSALDRLPFWPLRQAWTSEAGAVERTKGSRSASLGRPQCVPFPPNSSSFLIALGGRPSASSLVGPWNGSCSRTITCAHGYARCSVSSGPWLPAFTWLKTQLCRSELAGAPRGSAFHRLWGGGTPSSEPAHFSREAKSPKAGASYVGGGLLITPG